ncbi:SDR family NAD(P)-dependent oxidoreductase [Nocardioides sp. NPDC023903]|uniref:SDR family NAD(P)-dependent oxidoreductase n=1 Tax=Nocardioides sp. NPDC023903 TaxID=3157195 RepID=UPI0033EF7C0C
MLVVASALSFMPLAGLASYGASKAGVEMLTLGYRQEVAHLGVTVGVATNLYFRRPQLPARRASSADSTVRNGLRQRCRGRAWPGSLRGYRGSRG